MRSRVRESWVVVLECWRPSSTIPAEEDLDLIHDVPEELIQAWDAAGDALAAAERAIRAHLAETGQTIVEEELAFIDEHNRGIVDAHRLSVFDYRSR